MEADGKEENMQTRPTPTRGDKAVVRTEPHSQLNVISTTPSKSPFHLWQATCI